MSVVVVATIFPAPGRIDEVTALVLATLPAVHAEDGCELYALHRSGERLVMVEKWATSEHLDAHRSGAAVASLRAGLQAKTVAPTEIQILTALPGNGGDPRSEL